MGRPFKGGLHVNHRVNKRPTVYRTDFERDALAERLLALYLDPVKGHTYESLAVVSGVSRPYVCVLLRRGRELRLRKARFSGTVVL